MESEVLCGVHAEHTLVCALLVLLLLLQSIRGKYLILIYQDQLVSHCTRAQGQGGGLEGGVKHVCGQHHAD